MHPRTPRAVGGGSRWKLADLTSVTGAAVLALGLGVLGARLLHPVAPLLLAVGALLHAWGMLEKHRLEAGAAQPLPRWAQGVYWACWGALGLLLAWTVVAVLR